MTAAPPQLPLTRDRIVDEAMALVAEEGPDALSMRRLAVRLGTSTMSTYHHLPDKSSLLEAIAEQVMAELENPDDDAPWDDVLRQMSWSFRALTRRHRNVFQLLLAGSRPEALLRTAEEVIARLIAAGFSTERALLVFRSFIRYLLGVTMVESGTVVDTPGLEESFHFGIETLIAGIEPPS